MNALPYLRPFAYALFLPLAAELALYLFVPAMRAIPTEEWALIYAFSVVGALAGWVVASKFGSWRYKRAFRCRDYRTLDRIAARLRRLSGRGPRYQAYANIVEGDARLSDNRLAEAALLYGSAVSLIEQADIAPLKASVPVLKNNVAWCLVELDSEPQRALALATEAAGCAKQFAKPQLRASFLGTLGAAQFRNGQQEAAIANLREALVLHTSAVSRSSVLYYLGEALRESGRVDEALTSYRQSRAEDPRGRHGKLAAEKLTSL
jgi:tetratricopeptide (TPR) repeat protein